MYDLKYTVGDTVKVTNPDGYDSQQYKGTVHVIIGFHSSSPGYTLEGIPDNFHWCDDEVTLVKRKDSNMGKTRLYRVVKDTPAWNAGAVLKATENSDDYTAINDLHDAFEKDYPESYCECASIVENSPFFERVYEVSILKKAMYLNKKEAQAAQDKIYKEK